MSTADDDYLPPIHLPMVAWDELAEADRERVKDRLRADQRRRDAEARRQGRDPLAEAISAHLAACARTGAQPLMTFGDLR